MCEITKTLSDWISRRLIDSWSMFTKHHALVDDRSVSISVGDRRRLFEDVDSLRNATVDLKSVRTDTLYLLSVQRTCCADV